MARITEKNGRRFRVQFTMRRELYERYETCLTRAASLRLLVDFSQDFEDWFGRQLQQVQEELDRMESQQPFATVHPRQ
jgi:hypothetical protein